MNLSPLQRCWIALAALALAFSPALGGEEAEESFALGNAAYAQGDFPAAIAHYQAATVQAHSAALHYNLGNAYQQAGQPGRAILHYRRALLLEPGHAEALANLAFVRRAAELPDPPAPGLHERLSLRLPLGAWAGATLLGAWAAVFLAVLPRYFGGHRLATRLALAGALLLAALGGLGWHGWRGPAREAVVVAPEASLRVAPTPDSPTGAVLPAGETVRWERTHPDFRFVRSARGLSGWARRDEIEPVLP